MIIGLLWAFLSNPSTGPEEWYVNETGIISYPIERGTPVFQSVIVNYSDTYSLEYINYSSRDTLISALLWLPNSTTRVPGVLILPGAGVKKEDEQGLAMQMAYMGYASMVIDQRNLGGVNISLDSQLFGEGKEPLEHRMVFDALRAVDVMRTYPEIDPDRVVIVGISNGGRFGIIAAAIDPSISGVVGISTSGYDTESYIIENEGQISEEGKRFLRSIDPDSYLDRLPPRRFVLIHMVNDTLIPVWAAQATFDKADEPKAFYPVEGEGHGYNAAMRAVLEEELGQIFS